LLQLLRTRRKNLKHMYWSIIYNMAIVGLSIIYNIKVTKFEREEINFVVGYKGRT
jgi:hypothetical protein